MSKDITIEKVGAPQELNGVKKIITNSPDFFQATWIPEESTKPIGKLTVHRNGHYEASDFYAYGFDEVEVDVPQTPPEIEGIIDWDIPPIDIDFPDIDINIDDIDIGDIDIDIPDIDPMDIDIEDLEIIIKDIIIDIIDDLDIDIDIDDIDIDIPDIDLSDFTPEELKDLIDDIIKDIITDILGDLDIDDIDIDIPDIDVKLPDVEIPDYPSDLAAFSHIDENGNIVGITNQDLEDIGKSLEDIAAMEDPVITIDDLGNIEIVDSFGVDDFGGVEVIDLAVGDVDLKIDGIDDDGRTKFIDEYLPTSIELTVPPRKLVYHEGEPIDLTGAIVSAKYRGGTAVWANEKYRNGIIPLGELSTSVTNGGSGGSIMPDEEIAPITRPLNISDQAKFICPIRHDGEIQYTINKTFTSNSKNVKMLIYIQDKTTSVYQDSDCEVAVIIAADDNGYAVYDNTGSIPLQFSYTTLGKTAYFAHYVMPVLQGDIRQISPKPHIITGTGNYWNENALVWAMVYDSGDGKKTVTLSWPRPKDRKILTTSFEITMADDESEDNGNV